MIRADRLTKRYGSLTAVDDVSFKVEPGEVLGFLGPNGAGKTTTMRMLAGFVQPTAGQAEICGFNVESQPAHAKAQLGYLPEGAPSYGEMTPGGFLAFIADIRGLDGDTRSERLDHVIGRLQLGGVIDQPIETLSKGFRRRVGLAQAILHDPPVLILDEPTDGLDPNQKHEVRELIRDMSAEKIVVISTHILEEVDAVCNRAIIIANGRIVADETPDILIHRSRFHNAVTIRLERASEFDTIESQLREIPDIDHVEANAEDRQMTAFPKGNAHILTGIAQKAAELDWPLEQLHLESGRMDEVFRSITIGDDH